MLLISQWGVSIFGCAAFLLILSEQRRHQVAGTICGLASNPFWWIMLIGTGQWGAIPVHACYTGGWIWKAWQLWKAAPEPPEG